MIPIPDYEEYEEEQATLSPAPASAPSPVRSSASCDFETQMLPDEGYLEYEAKLERARSNPKTELVVLDDEPEEADPQEPSPTQPPPQPMPLPVKRKLSDPSERWVANKDRRPLRQSSLINHFRPLELQKRTYR